MELLSLVEDAWVVISDHFRETEWNALDIRYNAILPPLDLCVSLERVRIGVKCLWLRTFFSRLRSLRFSFLRRRVAEESLDGDRLRSFERRCLCFRRSGDLEREFLRRRDDSGSSGRRRGDLDLDLGIVLAACERISAEHQNDMIDGFALWIERRE